MNQRVAYYNSVNVRACIRGRHTEPRPAPRLVARNSPRDSINGTRGARPRVFSFRLSRVFRTRHDRERIYIEEPERDKSIRLVARGEPHQQIA